MELAPKDEVKFWFFATGFETLHLGIVAKDDLQTIMMNPKKAEIRESRLLKPVPSILQRPMR